MADNDPLDPIKQQIGSSTLDSPQSDAAIDDIVAQEADALLAAEDANLAAQAELLDRAAADQPHGHPIFWTVIAFFVILALSGLFLILSPDSSFAP